jgi:hypothetical protein
MVKRFGALIRDNAGLVWEIVEKMPPAFNSSMDRKQVGIDLADIFRPFLRQIQHCPPILHVDNEYQRGIAGRGP